jgi:AcrR family transcriptional regulator
VAPTRKVSRTAAVRKPRRRRTPELAREEILDAAERVFTHARPDEVGLKDVARSAGISHALITHYFGTYAGLVAATLVRRTRRMRGRILAALREIGSLRRPGELLGMLFATLDDPVHVRLLKWHVANGAAIGALALEDRGIALIAHEVAGALDPHPNHGGARTLETVELALLAVVASAYGFAMMQAPLADAIGRAEDAELSGRLQQTLVAMLASYLRDELGLQLPT